jgi:serine/threonine protein kinase
LKVLGYTDLWKYCDKFGFYCSFPNSEKETIDLPEFAIPWKQMRTIDNEAYATDEALDLLDRILVYDHDDGRITARQALLHPFFRTLNRDASVTIEDYNKDVLSLSQKKNIIVRSSDNNSQNKIKHQMIAGKNNDESLMYR